MKRKSSVCRVGMRTVRSARLLASCSPSNLPEEHTLAHMHFSAGCGMVESIGPGYVHKTIASGAYVADCCAGLA